MDTNSAEYLYGMKDGYMGEQPENDGEVYMAGYRAGEAQWEQEKADDREQEQAADDLAYNYWSEVEQGMYDDDPNPYHGDYSEM